ncbi:hypothetical protein JW835_10060 [bacterium]|nr:hypothetical protein [bacterium]
MKKSQNCINNRYNPGVFIIVLLFLHTTSMYGQGMTRSTGLGIRGGFWKINDQTMNIRVDATDNTSSINVEGTGASLTFFSRLYENWFMESSLGSVAKVQVVEKEQYEENVHVSVMIPLVFGVRYDLLTSRLESRIQPFVCAGTGTYWLVDTAVENDNIQNTNVSTQSDFDFGMYSGAGAHVILSSWFALNFISRYHFVDFSTTNPNSGFEFGFGFCFMWGKKREIFNVKMVKVIVEDIYPAYYRFYNMYPLAYVTIQNTAGYSIEVNLHSWIDGYTDGVRQSGFIEIPKGESKDIPVYLLFGPELLKTENREPAVIDLEIEARAGTTLRKSYSAQVVVHSKNAWNGEIDKLTVFVTPDDQAIHLLSRSMLKSDSVSVNRADRKFQEARLIFNTLGKRGIRYQSDPNIPFDRDDRVQFAPKTLSLGTGDCDDLVVLYASLLESIGISTAFIDVRDPEISQGHVYLIFDSSVVPEQGSIISSNEKRYLVRKNREGVSTLWIPVETTLIQAGFETAWKAAATQYMEEGVIRQGLDEGWVKIINVK